MTEPRRILSGMRATNPRLHLGNYEGALRNWVELQNQGCEMYCMVADYHALTTMGHSPDDLAQNSREVAKDFIAGGIDPQMSSIFVQSHVPQHAELHLILSMITPISWLERQPTYKEKLRDLIKDSSSPGARISRIIPQLKDATGRIGLKFDQYIRGIADDEVQATANAFLVNFYSDLSQSLLAARVEIDGIRDVPSGLSPDLRQTIEYAWSSIAGAASVASRNSLSLIDTPSTLLFQLYESLSKTTRQLDDALASIMQAPYGLLGYPVLQAADILLYKPYGVPVGRDQAPHLEIANDISARFNRITGVSIFERFRYLIPEDETRAKMPGLDADESGKLRKMSKSYDNCIYINESPDETAKKIMSAYTTPTKLKKTDPGVPEGCAVCNYLKLYSPDWKNQWEQDRMGLRGCVQNKKDLIEVINEFLRPMRDLRAKLDDATIHDVLKRGAERASERAEKTMQEVREAMRMAL